MVHLVLQIGEGQRLRGQLTVARVGTGNDAADQVHVSGVDVVTAVAGKQPALLAHALVAALGLARAGIAVSISGVAERHLHAATLLAVTHLRQG